MTITIISIKSTSAFWHTSSHHA